MLINQAYSMMNNIQNVVGDYDVNDDPEMKVSTRKVSYNLNSCNPVIVGQSKIASSESNGSNGRQGDQRNGLLLLGTLTVPFRVRYMRAMYSMD